MFMERRYIFVHITMYSGMAIGRLGIGCVAHR